MKGIFEPHQKFYNLYQQFCKELKAVNYELWIIENLYN